MSVINISNKPCQCQNLHHITIFHFLFCGIKQCFKYSLCPQYYISLMSILSLYFTLFRPKTANTEKFVVIQHSVLNITTFD